MSKRRNHDPAFKARVALEALKGEHRIGAVRCIWRASKMNHQWKKALLEGAADIFERGGKRQRPNLMRPQSKSFMPRSGSWPSPAIFWHESSSLGAGSEARDD